MSWSPSTISNPDLERPNVIYDGTCKKSFVYNLVKITVDDTRYTPPGDDHSGSNTYDPNQPGSETTRVIGDAEFCSLPNRTPVSCSMCGKVYRHKISYLKHQWEHHELWNTCLRFNVSKHQQVQMMEAAQILVDMVNAHPSSQFSPSQTAKNADDSRVP